MAKVYRMGVSVLNADGKWVMKYGKPYSDPKECVKAAVDYMAAHPRTRFMMWDDEEGEL